VHHCLVIIVGEIVLREHIRRRLPNRLIQHEAIDQ
jgi:hypothetical protein